MARDDIELLEALSEKMASAYQGLCDYVAIDAKKCPLNEFFGDLKSFCTIFLSCLQENRLWREQDEKAKRAAMSKQRIGELHKKNRAEAKPERSAYFKPSKSIFSFSLSKLVTCNRCLSRRWRHGCRIKSDVSAARCQCHISTTTSSSMLVCDCVSLVFSFSLCFSLSPLLSIFFF